MIVKQVANNHAKEQQMQLQYSLQAYFAKDVFAANFFFKLLQCYST